MTQLTHSQPSPISSVVSLHSSDFIVLGSLIALALGVLLGALYKPPKATAGHPMPLHVRVLFSIAGGLWAFIYLLDAHGTLLVKTPIWVAGAAWLAPAVAHIVHAAGVSFARKLFGEDV